MKSKSFPTRCKEYSLIFVLLGMVLSMTLLTSFKTDSSPQRIKSRFYSMIFKKSDIEAMMRPANFDHFIFQAVYAEKDGLFGGRRVYKLIVFACEADGKPISTKPFELKTAIKSPPHETTDRDDEVYMSNYKLSKKRYMSLFGGKAFDALKFDALPASGTWSNYILYRIYTVDDKEAEIVSVVNAEDPYLKPSPPAPPGEQ